nr:PREDICTED: reticulon-4 isoform X4 [Haliaeetus albicilla]
MQAHSRWMPKWLSFQLWFDSEIASSVPDDSEQSSESCLLFSYGCKRAYLESDVAVSEELIQKYSNVVLGHINGTVKELRRLFLVDDLVDSLKFAVLMWVFTYVGALFNGLTLLILALISLFSVPVIYERHQAQIDHYLGLVNKNVKDAMAKIQAKIPGLKRKTE